MRIIKKNINKNIKTQIIKKKEKKMFAKLKQGDGESVILELKHLKKTLVYYCLLKSLYQLI